MCMLTIGSTGVLRGVHLLSLVLMVLFFLKEPLSVFHMLIFLLLSRLLLEVSEQSKMPLKFVI